MTTHCSGYLRYPLLEATNPTIIFNEIILLLAPSLRRPCSISQLRHLAFVSVMTTTITLSSLCLSTILFRLCAWFFLKLFHKCGALFPLANIVEFSLSLCLYPIHLFVVNYRVVCRQTQIVLPIYRKNYLCAPHSTTHTRCHNVEIAFGDQYTHRDRSTSTPCYWYIHWRIAAAAATAAIPAKM